MYNVEICLLTFNGSVHTYTDKTSWHGRLTTQTSIYVMNGNIQTRALVAHLGRHVGSVLYEIWALFAIQRLASKSNFCSQIQTLFSALYSCSVHCSPSYVAAAILSAYA